MAQVIFHSELVTEYDDGTEEVRFTDDEWAVMAADPVAFGLALICGHSTGAWGEAEGCMVCFGENEARCAEEAAEEAAPEAPPVAADWGPDDAPF